MKHSIGVRFSIAFLTVCLLNMVSCKSSPQDIDTETYVDDIAGEYNFHIDMNPYADAIHTDNSDYRILVNKQNTVGENFAPRNLTTLSRTLTLYGKEIQMESVAARAAEAMIREMWACGYTDVFITSGYRTYAYQNTLFNRYMNDEKKSHPTWTDEQARNEVLTYSARPGTSEHQTGLCMDLIISDGSPALDESFADHPCYQWLLENAHRFGFILRFPKDKENETGYLFEPWHYRFVGETTATEIYTTGVTLETYVSSVH